MTDNNIFEISKELTELKKREGYNDYVMHIGNFVLHIYTNSIQDPASLDFDDSISDHEILDIVLHEWSKNNKISPINIRDDYRFKDYRPILYEFWDGPNGIINFGDGSMMPFIKVCHLIKYLRRLSNLKAFT
jgi:hypothetical protein